MQKLLAGSLVAEHALKLEIQYYLAKVHGILHDTGQQQEACLQGIQLWEQAQVTADR